VGTARIIECNRIWSEEKILLHSIMVGGVN